METIHDMLTEAQPFEKCSNPDIRKQVFKYLLDDLDDHEAEVVEDHLLECRYCRETFLTMLRIRTEADGAKNLRERRGEPAPNDAQILKLADSQKQDSEEKRPALCAKSARGPSK